MNIELTEISESDFKELELPILFEDELIDRIFGVISNGVNKYKFSWQSTINRPKVVSIDSVRCTIGIDLVFVIFDFVTGEILKKISLNYFFYDTKIFDEFIYVVTELEIVKINISDSIINKVYALPDYFESIELKKGNITVKCVSGIVIDVE